jgi:hypothetical protein
VAPEISLPNTRELCDPVAFELAIKGQNAADPQKNIKESKATAER